MSNAEAAFDDFVSARGPALWRTAWMLTGDRHRAEDLVQTALAKAWPKFDQVESFEAYVRRVMVNTYTSWWRRKWNGELPHAETGGDVVHSDAPVDVDLMAALAELPKGQRSVVVLRYFEGLSEREIAEQLSVSVGTVKSQASRALKTLKNSPLLQIQEVP
ncbi:hypothetical protein ASG90_12640 [Nocardioides sp. Soil797]|nr:hypothetical protein ASG90_12640 [Nocardioides sp. Soil797]